MYLYISILLVYKFIYIKHLNSSCHLTLHLDIMYENKYIGFEQQFFEYLYNYDYTHESHLLIQTVFKVFRIGNFNYGYSY